MTAITCKGCGAVVDDSWSACPACGADPRIGTPDAAAATEPSAAAPQPAFEDQAGAPYAPPPVKKAPRWDARRRASAPVEARIETTTSPPAPERPGATGKLPIARAALLLIVILFLVALIASGVYAAMRDAWTDVVYVVVAVVIFAVILLGDRRRKRRKDESPAAGAAQAAARPAPAGQREHATRTPSRQRTILRLLGTLVVLSLAAVGCWAELRGSEIEDSHEYNQLSARVTDLQAETLDLQGELERSFKPEALRPLMTRDAGGVKLGDPSPKELAAILPMLKEARGIVAERNERLASLVVLWDKMLRLDTGEPRNTYCRQNKQIEELDRQMGVVLDQYFAKLEEAGNQAPLRPTDASRMAQEISALLVRLDMMRPRYDELVRASWKYYNEEL